MKKLTLLAFALFCASVLSANIPAGTKLYLEPNIWNVGNERFAAYFFGSGGDAWVSMTPVSGTDYYELTAPAGTWSNVIFVRMNGENSVNSWDNRWNQTDDLTFNGTDNLFTVNAWHGGENNHSQGVWSVLNLNLEPSVSLNIPSAVYLGSSIVLNATARNVESPTFVFFVKAPGSQNFVEITSPYTPATVGVYTFRVEITQTSTGFPSAPIADEREVTVRELTIGNGITIGVRKPADWENIAIHYWTDEMPTGAWVVPILHEDDFYVYTFENADDVNFIFVNGIEWTTPDNQTFDITGIDASMCFEILDATHDGNTRRVRSLDCPFDTETGIINTTESNVVFYVANNVLNVIFEDSSQIELFTISGQLIKSQQAQSPFSMHLNSGVYLLRVNGEVHKVMVK